MKDKIIETEDAINNFVKNVHLDDCHDQVEITAYELLSDNDDEFPIIHSADIFVDCLIGYFEYVEKYEVCADLVKKREKVLKKLIPLGKFMTKNHELIESMKKRKNRNGNGENFGL